MTTSLFRAVRGVAGVMLCAAACASCGSVVREGRGSSYLILDRVMGSAGARPDTFGDVLQSDVITAVKTTIGTEQVMVPTVFEDLGRVVFRLGLKDVTSPTGPTTNNEITITRYHVRYIRSDGRNAQGVDVPYEFDGAITGTVQGGSPLTITFVVVRAQAKKETPLASLVNMGGSLVISTVAEVTFFGHDLAGNAVTATGRFGINFADWGDPQ